MTRPALRDGCSPVASMAQLLPAHPYGVGNLMSPRHPHGASVILWCEGTLWPVQPMGSLDTSGHPVEILGDRPAGVLAAIAGEAG
jgi:hypothetical protein